MYRDRKIVFCIIFKVRYQNSLWIFFKELFVKLFLYIPILPFEIQNILKNQTCQSNGNRTINLMKTTQVSLKQNLLNSLSEE